MPNTFKIQTLTLRLHCCMWHWVVEWWWSGLAGWECGCGCGCRERGEGGWL